LIACFEKVKQDGNVAIIKFDGERRKTGILFLSPSQKINENDSI